MHKQHGKNIGTLVIQEDIFITFKGGDGRKVGFKRREENVISRMRIGHTGLNHTLSRIGKHPTGKCIHRSQPETVEHVLLRCRKYSTQRDVLFQTLKKATFHDLSLSGLLGRNIRQYVCMRLLRF